MLIIVVFFFHPTIKSLWNSWSNNKLLKTYLNSLIEDQQLDPKRFWQFRERYGQGIFAINDEFVDILQTYKIIKRNPEGETSLLFYNGSHIKSIDSITVEKDVIEKIAEQEDPTLVLLQSSSILLTKLETSNQVASFELWFLLPIEEMMTTNGFFDYTSDERELLKGTQWLNHTYISSSPDFRL